MFLSNTAHDQEWQKEHDLKEKAAAAEAAEAETGVKAEEKPVDINQGKGIPGWVLRVEGRLIDVSYIQFVVTDGSLGMLDLTR